MCGEDKECATVMADGIANGAVDLDGPVIFYFFNNFLVNRP